MKDDPHFLHQLEMAEQFHGHLCSGQIIGVRLAIHGLDLIGITDPLGADRKKLIVFVEVARCAADAIMTVTGCRVGKRSFKFVDTGRLAATFYHMKTRQAVRVALHPDVPGKIERLCPGLDIKSAEKKIYRELPDRDLFVSQDVVIRLRQEDTPGVPATTVRCALCGEQIFDKREIIVSDQIVCQPCGYNQTYYQPVAG